MKRLFWTVGLVFCLQTALLAQWSGYDRNEGSELDAGIGMTWIDNHAYYTIGFQPDIQIGKFGFGLGLNLLYDVNTGKIRTQDWNTFGDYARVIRYIRYGWKRDSFYTRVGALDAERLGHGFIVNFYNNQIHYDERKLGLILDMDFGKFGFESITNNLGRWEVLGARGYYRPLFESSVPVLRNFVIGGSFVTDMDPDSRRETKNDVSILGVDVELPLIKSRILTLLAYADHAQIKGYGSGQTVGLGLDFDTLWGFLKLGVNVERRFLGAEFIPNYFGPFYEIFRNTSFQEVVDFYTAMGGDTLGIPEGIGQINISQELLLPMMTEERQGWYGGLYLDFFQLVKVMGSYQRIDHHTDGGLLHLEAGLSEKIPVLALEVTYDKFGVGHFGDLWTLDERSVARFGVGYKIKKYLLFYLDYIWSFQWNENEQTYEPQKRFQPRLAFRYHF
jgi:hypothetical protein